MSQRSSLVRKGALMLAVLGLLVLVSLTASQPASADCPQYFCSDGMEWVCDACCNCRCCDPEAPGCLQCLQYFCPDGMEWVCDPCCNCSCV